MAAPRPNSPERNRFYEGQRGVEAIGLDNLVVDRAFFGSSNTTVSSAPGAWAWNAVVAESGQYRNMIVSNDSVVNWVYGITLRNSMAVSGTMIPQPLISATGNYIRTTPAAGTALTSNGNVGILLENLTPVYSSSQVAAPSPWVEARNNRMVDVYNGISLSQFLNQWSAVTDNDIRMLEAQSGLTQFGIYQGATWECHVVRNDVYSTGKSNDWQRAIASSVVTRTVVNCNKVHDVARGFEFHSTNLQANWLNNEMTNNGKGYVVAWGDIGQQVGGGSTQGCNNRWLGTWPAGTAYHTYIDNSNVLNSPLNILFGGPGAYVPSNNGATFPNPPYKPTPAYVGIVPASGLYAGCGPYWNPGFAARGAAPPPGGDLSMLEAIAQDSLSFGAGEDRRRWVAQLGAYHATLRNPSLLTASPVLAAFRRLGTASRFAWLTEIQDSLAAGNDKAAAALLAALPRRSGTMAGASKALLRDSLAGDRIIANYVNYYQLYLNWHGGRFTATDSADLAALAELCPQLHGAVVLQARVLLHRISGHYKPYPDDCRPTGRSKEESRQPDNKRMTARTSSQRYQLAPNPNDGRLQLLQGKEDREPVRVSVYSAIGALVFQETRAFNAGTSSLELTILAPGMYYVNLQDSAGQTYTLRFLKQ